MSTYGLGIGGLGLTRRTGAGLVFGSLSGVTAIVAVGDSNTQGFNLYPSWPSQLAQSALRMVQNHGVNGQTIASLDTDYAGWLGWAPRTPLNAAVLLAGTNDFLADTSAATAMTKYQSLCGKLRTDFSKVVVISVLPIGGATAGQDAARVAFNSSLRSGWSSFADVFIDLARHPLLQNVNDTTYYRDTVHLTEAGYATIAGLAQQAVGWTAFSGTLGSEIVTNGTFASGTTGWSGVSASVANVGGELEVTGSGAGALASQAVNLEIGATYIVQCKGRKGTTSDAISLRIVEDGGSFPTIEKVLSIHDENQFLCFRFTPAAVVNYVSLLNENAGTGTSYWDNVSLKKLT